MSDHASRNIRVLLVDDEEDLVTLLAARLNKRKMDVVFATSGQKALDLSEMYPIDVAILDLKMPQMDGVEVMGKLKERHPMIETIMLTGHGSLDSALEAGKLEAFRYLLKPCDFDELVTAIHDAYRQRRVSLRCQYNEELQQMMEHFSTPHDILHHSEELRQKYEQD